MISKKPTSNEPKRMIKPYVRERVAHRVSIIRSGRYDRKQLITLVVGLVLIGVVVVVFVSAAGLRKKIPLSLQAPQGATTKNTDGSITFGGAGTTATVRRFFSPDASWNKTVAQMGGEFTELKPYAKRLWDYGGGTASGAPKGSFFLDFKEYSIPIYDVKDANTKVKLFQVNWAQNQQAFSTTGMTQGSEVPWNMAWQPGTGNDRILAVVDYEKGTANEYWVVGEPKYNCIDFFGPNAQAGYDASNPNHLCMAGTGNYNNLWTAKEGSTYIGRGMGINKLALVVRADEVASGNIGHALPLTTSNPMFGGTKSDNKMVSPATDPLQPGAGTTKGFYLKPATRLEHEFGADTLALGGVTSTGTSDAERAKTNPSGMRFALNITETEINAWLDSKGYTGVTRSTAQTFARAWRDYGAIIAETGGWGIGMETEGIIGPAKDKWAKLGIVDDGTKFPSGGLLDGLVTESRLYVVKTPQ